MEPKPSDIKKELSELLINYLNDIHFWIGVNHVDYWNSVTNGTPHCKTLDEAKLYRERVRRAKELLNE